MNLSDRQLRVLETLSRYLLVVAVSVFVVVAVVTFNEILELQSMVEAGNCTQFKSEVQFR